MTDEVQRLRAELTQASEELQDHMSSWEYAFAMGSTRYGGSSHPMHWQTHARTAELQARVSQLRARLAEHEL